MTLTPAYMEYVWPVTWVFVSVSLMTLFVLVVLRLFIDHRKKVYKARRKEMEKYLLIHLSNPLKDLKETLVVNPQRDMILLAYIAQDMFRIVKGASYERLRDTFKNIGFYSWLQKALHSHDVKECLLATQLSHHWMDDTTQANLLSLLSHPYQSIRYSSMVSLAHSQDRTLFKDVTHALEKEEKLSHFMVYDIFRQFDLSILEDLEFLLQLKTTSPRL
ncbi:MAG: hypothetical protein ACI9TY_000711 [Alphaproteobacteria bacterium]|jgi:hypothetical protein